MADRQEKQIHKQHKLTLISMVALVAGNIIGSGIFLLPSSLASIGSISLYSWVFTTIGAVLLALIFSILSKKISGTGGPYIYVKQVLGEFMGFQTAYSYWIAAWVGNAAIAIAFTGYLSVFFPNLLAPEISSITAIIIVWVLTLVNISAVKNIGFSEVILTFLKFITLIFICIFGWLYIQPDFYAKYYNISFKNDIDAISSAITITLWAFIGLESATIPAALVYKPHITIPLATMLGVLMSAVVYITSSTVIMGMINPEILQHSPSPFADAAEIILGDFGKYFMAAGAVFSCLGCLHGWILIQGQIAMAAADDGLFPKIFSKCNNEGIPVYGLLLSSLLITIFLILNSFIPVAKQFLTVILIATVASIMPYIYTIIAFLKLQKSNKDVTYKCLAIIISISAFIYLSWALFNTNQNILCSYIILFLIGATYYEVIKYKKRNKR